MRLEKWAARPIFLLVDKIEKTVVPYDCVVDPVENIIANIIMAVAVICAKH